MRKDLEDRIKKATELYLNGYNCSQSVVAAFADLFGYSNSQAMMMASGFGAGIARTRQMCGTVSGAIMLCGLANGNDEPGNKERTAACFAMVRSVLGEFKEKMGSTCCADLLGMNGEIKNADNNKVYPVRPCVEKVECAARLFAEHLEKIGK